MQFSRVTERPLGDVGEATLSHPSAMTLALVRAPRRSLVLERRLVCLGDLGVSLFIATIPGGVFADERLPLLYLDVRAAPISSREIGSSTRPARQGAPRVQRVRRSSKRSPPPDERRARGGPELQPRPHGRAGLPTLAEHRSRCPRPPRARTAPRLRRRSLRPRTPRRSHCRESWRVPVASMGVMPSRSHSMSFVVPTPPILVLLVRSGPKLAALYSVVPVTAPVRSRL